MTARSRGAEMMRVVYNDLGIKKEVYMEMIAINPETGILRGIVKIVDAAIDKVTFFKCDLRDVLYIIDDPEGA